MPDAQPAVLQLSGSTVEKLSVIVEFILGDSSSISCCSDIASSFFGFITAHPELSVHLSNNLFFISLTNLSRDKAELRDKSELRDESESRAVYIRLICHLVKHSEK